MRCIIEPLGEFYIFNIYVVYYIQSVRVIIFLKIHRITYLTIWLFWDPLANTELYTYISLLFIMVKTFFKTNPSSPQLNKNLLIALL